MIITPDGYVSLVCINFKCDNSEYSPNGRVLVIQNEKYNPDEIICCEKCGEELWTDMDEAAFKLRCEVGV